MAMYLRQYPPETPPQVILLLPSPSCRIIFQDVREMLPPSKVADPSAPAHVAQRQLADLRLHIMPHLRRQPQLRCDVLYVVEILRNAGTGHLSLRRRLSKHGSGRVQGVEVSFAEPCASAAAGV